MQIDLCFTLEKKGEIFFQISFRRYVSISQWFGHLNVASEEGIIQCVPGALSLRAEQLGCEADHTPPSSAEVKEWVDLYLHFPHTPSWRGAWLKKAQGQLYLYLCFTLENKVKSSSRHHSDDMSAYLSGLATWVLLLKNESLQRLSDHLILPLEFHPANTDSHRTPSPHHQNVKLTALMPPWSFLVTITVSDFSDILLLTVHIFKWSVSTGIKQLFQTWNSIANKGTFMILLQLMLNFSCITTRTLFQLC
jgi:hypothetical protein